MLVPLNCWWVVASTKYASSCPTQVSLFYNAVFTLFVLVVANRVGRIVVRRPDALLSRAELLTIYTTVSIGSSLAGVDRIRVLVPLLGHASWFATPENDWARLFHAYIPKFLTIADRRVLEGYYNGDASFYDPIVFRAWLPVILWWSAFIVAVHLVMLGLSVIVRRQWVEAERLSYPIIQLPIEMTQSDGRFFRSPWMWIGLAFGAGIDVLNGLNFLFPAVPSLGGKLYDLQQLFTERPWNAIGWSPMAVFPFAVGLSFFIPLDLAFSAWAFWLLWRAERIGFALLGRSGSTFGGTVSYESDQSHGAYLGLFVLAVWMSRRHLKQVGIRILRGGERAPGEPIGYRAAALGIGVGLLFILFFGSKMGMSLWVVGLFFAIWFAIAIAIARLRAELGSPVHDLHFIGPDAVLPAAFGTRRLGPANLTGFSYLYFLNRAHRSHVMPHQLEGLKLADVERYPSPRLIVLMALASVLGALASFWAFLTVSYRDGGLTWAWESFNRLERWLTNPAGPNVGALGFMAFGFLLTLVLAGLRMRFLWWSLHPVGYAISGSWAINPMIGSIFVGWLLKWLVLRFGGIRLHRTAAPFFLGLVLGEFLAGTFWSFLGILLKQRMYRFLF